MVHTATRQALWNEKSIHLNKAQDLDREIEKLNGDVRIRIAWAKEHRRVAQELENAAVALGKLDGVL